MADMYLGSQLPLYQNVHITVRNKKTGKIRIERSCKNRVTRLMLWGIARFLAGEFNDSTPDKIYEYIPRYCALGSNRPSNLETTKVTTSVTVDDSRLLNEYKVLTSNRSSEPVKRINIQGRQHNKTTTRFTDSFVKLSFSVYVSSSRFDGLEIGEAGLFSKEYDDNCLARVVFSPFQKRENEVIDIQWDITLLSYGTTKYPENVNISGPDKIIIPINYTPYHIKTTDVGLYYDLQDQVFYDKQGAPIFTVHNNILSPVDSIEELKKTYWYTYISSLTDSHLTYEAAYNLLTSAKLDGSLILEGFTSNYYKEKPCHFYLGAATRIKGRENMLADVENNLLHDNHIPDTYEDQLYTSDPVPGVSFAQTMCISYIYKENIEYIDTPTGYVANLHNDRGDYVITGPDGDTTEYKVISYEIFKRDDKSASGYVSTGLYMYSGSVVDKDKNITKYIYDSTGVFYTREIKEPVIDSSTNTFIIPRLNNESVRDIYKLKDTGEAYYTNYWIDWENDKEVYNVAQDTFYHITQDNYFATGDSYKLVPVISPADATDKTVSWSVANKLISKVDTNGVVTAWNVGDTLVFVSTTNGIKSRVNIEVVKNAALVNAESIVIDPESISFNAATDGISGNAKEITVKATVLPAIATYSVVEWYMDADGNRMCNFVSLGDNSVKITLNESGNIGRGYITASLQNGLSAKCLITVSYETEEDEDCKDPTHDKDKS